MKTKEFAYLFWWFAVFGVGCDSSSSSTPATTTAVVNPTPSTTSSPISSPTSGPTTLPTPTSNSTSIAPPGAFSIDSAAAGNAQAIITWAAASGASSYIVKYGTSSGSYGTTFSSSASSPTTITGLTNNTRYYFMITAVNAGGTTNATAEATAMSQVMSFALMQQLGENGKITKAGGVAVDGAGNIFVAGFTSGSLTSCNGVSASCSGSSQGSYDYFVSKYNTAGVWQWTQQLGESGSSAVGGLVLVAADASGNVFVAGSIMSGNLPTCSGISANCTGSSEGTIDYFVSKYNASGTFQWTKQLGEAGKITYATSIAADSSGNVLVAGYSDGNLVSCNGTSATCLGNSQGADDYFISKYDGSGIWQWTTQLGETSLETYGTGIATDSNNNIVITGSTSGGDLVSCGGISANCSGSHGGSAAFVSKYSSTGSWQWTEQLGWTSQTIYKNAYSNAVSVDSNGNVYIAGSTDGDVSLCNVVVTNCGGSNSSQGTSDYFIAKYSSNGTWQWTTQLGETAETSTAEGITVTSSNNVVITGYTTGNLASCAGTSINCSGLAQGATGTPIPADYFLSVYNTSGSWLETNQLGETGRMAISNGVTANSTGGVFVVGYTNGNLISCNGVSASCSGGAYGTYDYFLSKYQ